MNIMGGQTSIKKRLIVYIVILILAAVVFTLTPAIYFFTNYADKAAQEQVVKGANGVNLILEQSKDQAMNYANIFANHPNLIKAVEEKNVENIFACLGPLVKEAKIDFVTIADERGNVIARIHEPSKKGDSVISQANVAMALKGIPFAAVEPGTVVKLSARAGMPIKNYEGKIIGVVSTGYDVSNNNIVDKAKLMFGTDATLFLGDTRIATTIMKDGQRIIGTKINEKIADQVLKQGIKYTGQVDIFDKKFVVSYIPLIGPDNKPIGVIFSGQSTEEVDASAEMQNKIFLTVGIICLIILMFSIVMAECLLGKIVNPLKKLVVAANKLAVGDVDVNIEVMTKDEVGVLCQSFAVMVNNIRNSANIAEKLAAGDLTVQVEIHSEQDILGKSLKKCIDNISALVTDTDVLVQAAVEGRLSARSDSKKHGGDFCKIVDGINKTLDSVIGPLGIAAEYVAMISKGQIPPKITENYKGDFNEIKNNLNNCIDNINMLVDDANYLAQMAVDGNLNTRVDTSKHQGDYRRIMEGINQTLDAVVEPIKEASVVLKEMANGNLQLRVKGDYKGDHAEIKNAMNETLESLGAYVKEIAEVLAQMANSNLAVTINNEYKGDFTKIKDALNLIIQSFNEVFNEINNASDQVATGSRQVSDGSQALSQGATEQASSVEELTIAIAEVANQTKENAINANKASRLALQAKDNAEQGNQSMLKMLNSMAEINESSSKIAKIIKVIDGIAFQTNILALNAAVEAARAGHHGKGFAVVAEEVRNLAARSAYAAKETTVLIEGSVKNVEDGTRTANETASALEDIVVGITTAANLVGVIANASNEQASAIAQINKGVEQVAQVIQNNSATAQQSAAASEELSGQADMLKDMIGKFILQDTAKLNGSYKDDRWQG